MLNIIKSGLQTTIQDLGRHGFQQYGVIASGAMDPVAHRLSNILVGNTENTATIEITLIGPVIEFQENSIIALCGADLTPKIDDKPVAMWRPLVVSAGSTLSFGAPVNGSRTYLAIAGGIDVPVIMDSRSTYLRAGIGGHLGRALQNGDELTTGPSFNIAHDLLDNSSVLQPAWSVPALPYSAEPVVRVIPGRQFNLFDPASQERFWSETFFVSTESDRMGCRLENVSLQLTDRQELISEAVAFGTIQVPPNGHPIILLADRQTTGGYPKIADIISVDLPLVGQLKPGDQLRFQQVTLEEAQNLYIAQEKLIQELKTAIRLKWEEWQ